MGSSFAISPNLDKLAAEGVLFQNAHTSCPVCMPARCSLMTGVHAHVHGCIENGFERVDHLPMLPDLLKKQGYYNIMVGKTHFGPISDSFDVQKVTHGEKNADSDDVYASHIKSHGFLRSTKDMKENNIPENLFMDSFLAETTIDEIKKAVEADNGPFFAFCSMVSPHSPIDPPGKWATLYDDIELPEINFKEGEIAEHPPALKELLGYPDQPDEQGEALLKRRKRYYGLAAYCDHQVGRLMQFLYDAGLRENTLVIFTSDHGQQYMDHGFNDKHNWYDETWRVPLIMSQPGTIPSGEKRDFAMWHDLTVSMLAVAGTQCSTMQGFDLYTPLINGAPNPRSCANASLFQSVALATERWKLEYYFEDGKGRLFDRINDPQEQHDLWASAEFAEVKAHLLEALLSWRGDAIDLCGLQNRIPGGGPISKRATSHIKNAHGIDSEKILNDLCVEI